MKCQILFSGININLLSAELAQRVVKVKFDLNILLPVDVSKNDRVSGKQY